MHKIGKIAIFQGEAPYLREKLVFCPVVPNICAEFEPNRRSEHYHLLPGFLMDTLLRMKLIKTLPQCAPQPYRHGINQG